MFAYILEGSKGLYAARVILKHLRVLLDVQELQVDDAAELLTSLPDVYVPQKVYILYIGASSNVFCVADTEVCLSNNELAGYVWRKLGFACFLQTEHLP